jgi:hypothetical protein
MRKALYTGAEGQIAPTKTPKAEPSGLGRNRRKNTPGNVKQKKRYHPAEASKELATAKKYLADASLSFRQAVNKEREAVTNEASEVYIMACIQERREARIILNMTSDAYRKAEQIAAKTKK